LRRSLEIHDDRAQINGMSEWVRTRVAPLKVKMDGTVPAN